LETAEAKAAENYFAIADVCIPNTVLETLSFGVNENIKAGSLVWVSLRGRKKPSLALVFAVHKNFPNFKLKPAIAHESNHVFSERYLETIRWCASYYMCSLGEALTAFHLSEPKRLAGVAAGESCKANMPTAPLLTCEQQKALDILTTLLLPTPPSAPLPRGEYNFRGALLHGVTGSGKTRVYLELVRKALDLGMKTLILVPEINLTPQTKKRFEDFLGQKIPILHSKLGAKEKRETWQKLLQPHTPILMGTRSAILAPFEPELIIIDEEHDASYKQQDPAPRYNVREMAFHIGHKYGALVVLGSATPCMETYNHAKNGNLKLIEMKSRPGGLPLPKVLVVDMKEQRKKQDKDLMLSPVLRDALAKTISGGNQAIILLNRRGHSTSRICEECGEPLECKDCKVSLVYHKQYNRLMCHYCGRLYPQSMPCGCGSDNFVFLGSGIEKAEEEIKEWLPSAKVLRLDSDTTQGIGKIEKLLHKFRDKEYNVLLGTQMVAKGHDFPNVSLVGILCADIGSGLPDFRANERYFQLLTQVAGRAGRFLENSQVIIQSFCPENPVMQFAITHDYLGFAKWELTERQEAFYPPFCKIAQIKLQAKDKGKLEKAAGFLAEVLGQAARDAERGRAPARTVVLGPVEPFAAVVQKKHRLCVMVKCGNSADLKNCIKKALENSGFKKTAKGVEVRVDRDA
jgi:primosomal protein N' (replication factor Y)